MSLLAWEVYFVWHFSEYIFNKIFKKINVLGIGKIMTISQVCNDDMSTQAVCRNILFLVCGYNKVGKTRQIIRNTPLSYSYKRKIKCVALNILILAYAGIPVMIYCL